MGEKNKKNKFWDISCPACNKKYLREKLKEGLYIDNTNIGDCITCPNCDYQWIEE